MAVLRCLVSQHRSPSPSSSVTTIRYGWSPQFHYQLCSHHCHFWHSALISPGLGANVQLWLVSLLHTVLLKTWMSFTVYMILSVFALPWPDTYENDVYNPEAPSITNTSRPLYRHRVNAQRPNLIGLTMGDVDQPQRGIMFCNQLANVVLNCSALNCFVLFVCFCFCNLRERERERASLLLL